MFSKGIFTNKNTLILVCMTFLDHMDIKFSNKINLTVIYIVYKRRTERYTIMWPQNDKRNLFFYHSYHYTFGNIQKNNPTLYKSNNNVSWQKRRGHWNVCEKRGEYGWQAIKNNNDWEKQTSSVKSKVSELVRIKTGTVFHVWVSF